MQRGLALLLIAALVLPSAAPATATLTPADRARSMVFLAAAPLGQDRLLLAQEKIEVQVTEKRAPEPQPTGNWGRWQAMTPRERNYTRACVLVGMAGTGLLMASSASEDKAVVGILGGLLLGPFVGLLIAGTGKGLAVLLRFE